jgi:prepilin-type N-terminal cleavage/methylation domain-containing protein
MKRFQAIRKILSNSKGMTLVEIIVALAIFAIIVVFLAPILSNSYLGVINSGNKSEALYENQESLEEVVAGEDSSDVGVVDADRELTISFGSEEIQVNGDLILSEEEYGNSGKSSQVYYYQVK